MDLGKEHVPSARRAEMMGNVGQTLMMYVEQLKECLHHQRDLAHRAQDSV